MENISSVMIILALYVLSPEISARPTRINQTCPEECKCYRNENSWDVNCSRSSLQELPDFNNMEIEVLDLSGNLLSEFPRGLNMSHLTHLYVAHNHISGMEADDLKSLPNLISLDLSYNNITSWQNLRPNDVFQGATHLKYLYLNGNRLHALTDENAKDMIYSSSLQELYLEYCAIHTVNTITIDKALPKIRMMSFSGNDLGNDISLVSTHLRKLDLSNCNIERIETSFYRGLPKLEKLNVSGNLRIQVCDDHRDTMSESLSFLDMSNCSLEEIHVNCFSNLHEVNLRNNELKSLKPKHFEGLFSLTRLDLSHNQINNIENVTFMKVRSLTSLDLSFNSLSILDEKIIIWNTKLVSLNLSHNEFKAAPLLISESLDRFIKRNCKIQEVNEESRADLKAITDLALQDNSLGNMSSMSSKTIEFNENRFASLWSTTFLGFPHLTSLKLSHKTSTSPAYKSLMGAFPQNRNVWLGNNMYQCRCDLHQESVQFMDNSVKIHVNGTYCDGNRSLKDFKDVLKKAIFRVFIGIILVILFIIYIRNE